MKTASRIVVVSFFVTVSLLVLYSLLTQAPKSPRVLAAEDAATIRNLRFFTTFWQIACAATAAVLLVTVLPVGLSYSRSLLKKASVHLYKVGSSEIVVHERDLSLAWPVATGLVKAPRLEQVNGGLENAFPGTVLFSLGVSVRKRLMR